MDTQKIIQQLETRYPGKNIVCYPSEVICEIEPTPDHPDWSLTIAVIDKSQPHKHHQQTEIYEVTKGECKVVKNNQEYTLKPGERLTINPGETHFVIGKETWIKCYSQPGWTLTDHILV